MEFFMEQFLRHTSYRSVGRGLMDNIEHDLLQAEDQLRAGTFNLENGRLFHSKLHEFLLNSIALDGDIVYLLRDRLCNIHIETIPKTVQCMFGVIRYIFHVVSVVDIICQFSDDEGVPSVNVLTRYLEVYDISLNTLLSKLKPTDLDDTIINEFLELAKDDLENGYNAASFFITSEVLKLGLRVCGEMINRRTVFLNLVVLQSKSIDIKKNPEFVLSQIKPLMPLLNELNTNRPICAQAFQLQSEAYEEKQIYSLAIERAKSAREKFDKARDKQNMTNIIERLEEKQRNKEKSALENKVKSVNKAETSQIKLDQMKSIQANDTMDTTPEETTGNKYSTNIVQRNENAVQINPNASCSSVGRGLMDNIEHDLLQAEDQLKAGTFNLENGRLFHSRLHEFLLNSIVLDGEIVYLLRDRLCNFHIEAIPENVHFMFGVMRYIFHVISVVDITCQFDDNDYPACIVPRRYAQVHDVSLKTLRSKLKPTDLDDTILIEFLELAKEDLRNGYNAASFFIATEVLKLGHLVFREMLYNRTQLLNLIIVRLKAMEIKKNPEFVLSEIKPLMPLMPLMNTNRPICAQALQLQSEAYEEKQIYSLAIERAKFAREKFDETSDKQIMTNIIKRLEEKQNVKDKVVTTQNKDKEKSIPVTIKTKEVPNQYSTTIVESKEKSVKIQETEITDRGEIGATNTQMSQYQFNDLVEKWTEECFGGDIDFEDTVFDGLDPHLEPIIRDAEAKLAQETFDESAGNDFHGDLRRFISSKRATEANPHLIIFWTMAVTSILIERLREVFKRVPETLEGYLGILRYIFHVIAVIENVGSLVPSDVLSPVIGIPADLASLLDTCWKKMPLFFKKLKENPKYIKELTGIAELAFQNGNNYGCVFITERIDGLMLEMNRGMPTKSCILSDLLILQCKAVDCKEFPRHVMNIAEIIQRVATTKDHTGHALSFQAEFYKVKKIYNLAIQKAKEAKEIFQCDEEKKRMVKYIEELQELEQNRSDVPELNVPFVDRSDEEYDDWFDTRDLVLRLNGEIEQLIDQTEHLIIAGKFDKKAAEEFDNALLGRLRRKQDHEIERILDRILQGFGMIFQSSQSLATVIGSLRNLFHMTITLKACYCICVGDEYELKVNTSFLCIFHAVANALFSVQKGTEKNVLIKFCREVKDLAKSNLNADEDFNPASFFMCNEIRKFLTILPPDTNELIRSRVVRELSLVLANSCRIRPNNVIVLCRDVIDLTPVDDTLRDVDVEMKVQALELQAHAFKMKTKLDQAIKKATEAKDLTKDLEVRERLGSLIEEIKSGLAKEQDLRNKHNTEELQKLQQESGATRLTKKTDTRKRKRRRYKKPESKPIDEIKKSKNRDVSPIPKYLQICGSSDDDSDVDSCDSFPLSVSTTTSSIDHESDDSAYTFTYSQDKHGDAATEIKSSETPPQTTWFEESEAVHSGKKDKLSVCLQYDIDVKDDMKGNLPSWEPFYPELKSLRTIDECIKTQPNKYKKCIIHIESAQIAVARPVDSPTGREIEIRGRSKIGQTFHEDVVCVEIIDDNSQTDTNRSRVYGKVVGIFDRNRHRNVKNPVFVCTVDDHEAHLMRPICKTIPKISTFHNMVAKNFPKMKNWRIEMYQIDNHKVKFKKYFRLSPDKRSEYLFVVAYITWDSKFAYPKGVVLDVITSSQSYETCLKVLDMQYNIDPVYPQNVIEETKKLTKGTITSSKGIEQVITIDPKGSKDLDDALNVQRISDNEFLVGIHIADVASWVKRGYYIDLEARRRAVSFYPTQWRTIHMIPEPLSQNHCSLIEGENRQAISVYFRLNAEGEELEEPWIKKSVVNSEKQLSYQEAQEIIEGNWRGEDEKTEFVKDQVIDLYKLSKSIRKVRLCDKILHVPYSDGDAGEDCVEAHYLVEEFMIMANFFVAKLLIKEFPSGIPVRYQENPDNVSLIEWFNQYHTIGNVILNLQGNSCESAGGQHTLSLEKARGLNENYVTIQKNIWKQIIDAMQNKHFETARRFLCMDELHPGHFVARKKWENIMETAQYTCSAEEGINLNHFSLQKKPYTHFTSPIRRYVDLVVHRFIHAYLDGTSAPYTNGEIQELCIHLNERTKMQKRHQKETLKMYLAMDLGQHPVPFNGYISHTDDDGLQLQIPKWKFLPLSNKEVPFHLIDVCEKPEVKQARYINGDITTTTWKKRSYHTLGTQISVRPKLKPYDKLELDPNQNCVYLKISTWAKLISDVVSSLNVEIMQQNRKRHRKDAMEIVDSVGLDGQRPAVRFGTAEIVSCEGGNNTTLLNLCRFSYTFAPGRLISAEMSSVIEKGIPTPKISLLHLTKNLSFCLAHKENPVACLAKFAHQSTSEAVWQSVEDYIDAWHAVLEMEAAVTSANSGDETIFLEDVTIDFLGLRKGRFMLGLQFCLDRNIFGLDFAAPRKDTVTPISDFMCIRYAPEKDGDRKFTWVAHGVMESIERDDNMLCIEFNLHEKASTSIPRNMMDGAIKGSFTIEILPRSKTDRRLMNALQPKKLNDAPLAKAIALNRPIPRLDGDHYHLGNMAERDISEDLLKRNKLPGNNIGQHEAIDKALASSFTLIQGPPGTGKTYTGIKLAYLFAKINNIREIEKTGEKTKADEDEKKSQKHQVLYCGPSNKAVDVVARNLKNKLGEICPKIIRIYGSVIKNEDFPIPGQYISKSAVNREGRCPKDLYDISLHHVIRQPGKLNAQEIRRFDEIFRKEREKPDSQGISAKIIRSYNKLVSEAERHELPNYDVILCTAAIAGSQKYTSATNIFQCIIDECGMCTEPESMLPIIETKAKQVVLIGDHKQLRPIVLCSEAAKLGLERSLFERYAERAVFLNRQYRMHPNICNFPSTQFYDGKLETAASLSWKIDRPLRFLPANAVMMFYHIEGAEESLTVHTDEGHEKSKSNTAEADKVIYLFLHMVRREGCHPKSINIMTQYKSQMSLLQKRLKELNFDVTVNTVVASQGGEWDYVILSTVRSQPTFNIEPCPTLGWKIQNLGFVADQNQTNVALTRARKGLFIIGNENLLRCDKVWKNLLEDYKDRGCISNAEDIPRPTITRRPLPYC
ncbi:hypothetical protein SNE40_011556 [Patella caerulea]|uniref:RNB domain-containing protein n=1 Tax=Patella caerulea TaxID=87958 RepID=A0AAN8JJF0_PATCE